MLEISPNLFASYRNFKVNLKHFVVLPTYILREIRDLHTFGFKVLGGYKGNLQPVIVHYWTLASTSQQHSVLGFPYPVFASQ